MHLLESLRTRESESRLCLQVDLVVALLEEGALVGFGVSDFNDTIYDLLTRLDEEVCTITACDGLSREI